MTDSNTTRSKTRFLIPAVILVVAAALIALIIALQQGSTADPASNRSADPSGRNPDRTATPPGAAEDPQSDQEPDFSWAERRDEDDLLAAGEVDAPIGLIVFSDYQCPFCAQWHHETMPELEPFIENGQLRIEWRDLNVFGPASERASKATYAAALQGSFWEYHDALFEGGEKRSERELSEDALIELAEELGLDRERFTADLISTETEEEILRNQQLGFELGAISTPSFLLGGVPIQGAQPAHLFVDVVEAMLIEHEETP